MNSWLGINDPIPRTCRSMDPRLTESIKTVLRSTSGAAGFRRMIAIVSPVTTTRPITVPRIRRRCFCFLMSGRAMSITGDYATVKPFLASRYVFESEKHVALRWTRTRRRLSVYGVVCPLSDRRESPLVGGGLPRNAALLEQFRDQTGPPGLMAGAESNAGVRVKIFVEENVITPVSVGLERFVGSEYWAASI